MAGVSPDEVGRLGESSVDKSLRGSARWWCDTDSFSPLLFCGSDIPVDWRRFRSAVVARLVVNCKQTSILTASTDGDDREGKVESSLTSRHATPVPNVLGVKRGHVE